ncbi:MAG: DUF4342 domain-containing protein [Bauldia sp.]
MNDEKKETRRRTFTEEMEIAGSELVGRIKGLVAEGNVRQVRIKAPGGEVWFETPLTVGVLAGGAVALAAPWLAILGAIAGLVARVKVEIVREEPHAEPVRPATKAKTKTRRASATGPRPKAKGR